MKPIGILTAQKIFIAKSHSAAIEYLNCSAPAFYEALSTTMRFNGILLVEILNPEVLGNVRDSNKGKQSDPDGQSTHESEGGEDDGIRSQTRDEDSQEEKSEEAKRLLAKWGSPAAGNTRKSGAL
jgi:hypothetical protein